MEGLGSGARDVVRPDSEGVDAPEGRDSVGSGMGRKTRLEEAAPAIEAWYARHARDLPWRREVSPYRVLVSEVMLQQTTVETAARYFERFMASFPSVRALAQADVEMVLALWSGLGYYRRARNLHAAARIIDRDHGGRVPDDREALRKLPGIGPYTAAAILSIAYGRSAIALDGNLKRILARLTAFEGDVGRKEGERALLEAGTSLMGAGDPSSINQALMDIGATLCTPRAPRCLICPLSPHCEARRRGNAESIHASSRRPAPLAVTLAAAVLRDRGRVLLRRRAGSLMEGFWDFPMVETGVDADAAGLLEREMIRAHGAVARELRLIGTLRHSITRHRIWIAVFEGVARMKPVDRVESSMALGEAPARGWVAPGGRAVGRSPDSDLAGASSHGPARWVAVARVPGLPLTGIARKILLACGGPGALKSISPRRRRSPAGGGE